VHQLITQAIRIFTSALVIIPLSSACADGVQLLTPPFDVPFEAQKAGSIFTSELRLVEHRSYVFALFIKAKKGTSMEDARRLIELAGSDARYKNGKPLSYGVSMPVKLTVSLIDPSGEKVIYDKEIQQEDKIGAGVMGIEKVIDVIDLRPGHYKVSVQSLKDTPEYSENPVTFGVVSWPNTNPID
jgi:hypothetical protein